MIVGTIKFWGQDFVLEFHRSASWIDWSHMREGESESHTFLGKFAIIRSRLDRCEYPPKIGLKLHTVLVVGVLCYLALIGKGG